jgi:hypothetical protein
MEQKVGHGTDSTKGYECVVLGETKKIFRKKFRQIVTGAV